MVENKDTTESTKRESSVKIDANGYLTDDSFDLTSAYFKAIGDDENIIR